MQFLLLFWKQLFFFCVKSVPILKKKGSRWVRDRGNMVVAKIQIPCH